MLNQGQTHHHHYDYALNCRADDSSSAVSAVEPCTTIKFSDAYDFNAKLVILTLLKNRLCSTARGIRFVKGVLDEVDLCADRKTHRSFHVCLL